MTRKPIEETANEVWAFVLGYYQDKGYMPTNSEIGAHFEKTRQWAHLCLAELERQGKIQIIKNKLRGIQLI